MNLVQLSYTVRTTIKVAILLVITGILYVLLKPFAISFYQTIFPPKDPPTPIFGRLDALEFVEKSVVGSNAIDYELNTTTGNLPGGLPNKMTVYKYNESGNLPFTAGKQAQNDAALLGFSDSDLSSNLEGDVYTWRNAQLGSTLEIVISTRELVKRTSLTNKADLYPTRTINAFDATELAGELFTALGRFEDEAYINGEKKVTLGKFVEDEVLETGTALDAQLARVDLYREIGDYPILGPDPYKGLLHVVLARKDRKSVDYLDVEAYYWEFNKVSNASYPIITVAEAWNEITKGNGVIAGVDTRELTAAFERYRPVKINEVLINSIYLAYYDNVKTQKYLQPIYVFEGNYIAEGTEGDITLYFPAIQGQYVQSSANTTETDILF